MMYQNIEDLAKNLANAKAAYRTIVATSGGFDPLHVGHLRCLKASKQSANQILVVIVNGDGFLTRKKGKPFMKLEERLEIIQSLEVVDFVVPWDDGSQNVIGALKILQPNVFTKGGDRCFPEQVPEYDICQQIGCRVLFGVGGGKIQSSSELIRNG